MGRPPGGATRHGIRQMTRSTGAALRLPLELDDDAVFGNAPQARKAHASHLLRRAARALGWPVDVKGLGRLGDGLTYETFAARIGGQDVVVRIPHGDEPDEQSNQARSTAHLLGRIARVSLPFDRPITLALIETPDGAASVQTRLFGLPLWQIGGRPKSASRPCDEPWRYVGEAAATIHGLDPAAGQGLQVMHATRRAHALDMAEPMDKAEADYMPEVAAWAQEHLPPATPARLLHGDLLGQNVLWQPGADRVGVIDWEAARLGDPAYDLAIMTRGRRKPFGYADGLMRLIDAYNAHAKTPLSAAEVQLHELCLMAAWIVDCEGEAVAADYRRRGAALWKRVQAGCG